ncbi:MAG: MFS transporter [Dehalococcoidales bacterium]
MLAHLSHHLVTALPVPLLPFIRDEFALDYTRAGLVIAVFSIVYGACQLPGGWLADRLGPRILITIGIGGSAVTGLLAGLSQNYLMLLISLILMGVLGGGYHPAATSMISSVVEPKRRGQALGYHMIGGGTSYFLAPLIAAGIAAAWGWRGTFIGLAIPTIAFGILLYVFLGRRVPTKKVEPETTTSYTEAPPIPGRLRRLIALISVSTFSQTLLMSIISFIPLFLVDNFGTDKEIAAASISIPYFMGLWAGPVGGYLADRWGKVPLLLTLCFTSGTVIYLLNLAPPGLGIGAILGIIGITMYFNTTAAQAYIVDQVSERHHSTALGIFFFGSMEGSGILTPALGYLIDQSGFQFSFTISAITLFALTLACSVFLWVSRH